MQEIEMKKMSLMLSAVCLSLVFASADARAGSAVVNQTGDNTYTAILQFGMLSKTISHPIPAASYNQVQRLTDKMAAKIASRPLPGGKFGALLCGGAGTGNSVSIGQRGFRNSSSVAQNGTNNEAVVVQSGENNAAYTVQSGNNHYAQTTQTGNNNVALVVQRC